MCGDVFDRTNAHGRQGKGYAELLGCPGRQDLAVGVLHAGQPGGRQRDWHGDWLADHGGLERAIFQVDRYPLAKLDAFEITAVGAIGRFSPGAGIGIVVEHAWHAPLGKHTQVFDRGDDGHC
ncbi:hypothetical protein D3C78_1582410 [compost metagenome]